MHSGHPPINEIGTLQLIIDAGVNHCYRVQRSALSDHANAPYCLVKGRTRKPPELYLFEIH